MKVAVNTFPLSSIHSTRGVGFYTKYLVEELKKIKDIQVQEFNHLEEVMDADIIHYPYFDLFYHTLKLHKKIPTVVTIHDVTPLLFPKHYPPGLKGQLRHFLQRNELRKIEGVITDSEVSKTDIHKTFHIPEKKIFVTYLSQAEHFKKITDKKNLQSIENKYNLPEKFALFTGNVNWNKNIVNLTQACIDAGVPLFLVGKSFESRENLEHAEQRNFKVFLEKYSANSLVHILGFVSNEDLVALMNVASVVLLPSFYEGFGMTILEAQACGTPVITSNISSMPEVGGDAVLYVDPYSVESIAKAVRDVISNTTLSEKLTKKGMENIKRFSWEKTATETVKAYHEILS